MTTERVQAFSDAVFSILITILVLEFNVPAYEEGKLLAAVLQQWPKFFAYIMTFTYIGILWLFHHDLFSEIQLTTAKLNILNLFSIFLTTLLSYSMSLLAASLATMNQRDLRFAIAFYALLALGISISYLLFYRYIAQNAYLLQCSRESMLFKRLQMYPFISCLLYLLALVSSFFSLAAGMFFLIIGVLFHYYAYWLTLRNK